jgi:hypothetical protein
MLEGSTQMGVSIPHLGCSLTVGSTILLHSGQVAKIVEVPGKDSFLLVSLYKTTSEPSMAANPLLRFASTVTRSAEIRKSISIEEIMEIAFVFNAQSPLLDQASLEGMSGVFVTTDDKDYIRPELRSEYDKFSYHERIWHGMMFIQQTLRRLMSKYGSKQKLRQTEKFRMDNELWRYILRNVGVHKNEMSANISESRQTLQVITTGGRCHSSKDKKNSFILRFVTPSQLCIFCRLFGELSVIGIRKPRPPLDQSREILENDVVNVVVASHTQAVFKRHSVQNGVDLEYDGVILRLVVRYSRYILLVHPATGEVLKCPSERLVKILQREDLRPGRIIELDSDQSLCGLHFQYNNSTYKITRVPSTPLPIEAICLSDGTIGFFSNRELVEAEVDRYLS